MRHPASAGLASIAVIDRRDHLEAVRGSFALEGLVPDQDTRALLERWAAGQLSSADLDADVQRIVAQTKARAHASYPADPSFARERDCARMRERLARARDDPDALGINP